MPSTIFWHNFAKCSCRKKQKKLFAQKLLCLGAKNVGEIDHSLMFEGRKIMIV
jgi:hypothetical protein